eukprot:CAMPEP_0118835608 /NCGR_PEP_ID=MMETSP1162-20130426/54933_1 /TAXON_ID=33656 /ORGANISM="Phaeocystis Sp, Strain CCMP2710" /LENGTH=61 /DNA_ID=CAMNT_0006767381 /DNA_START=60 /DNA_END=242 /DNA_ORIENTATION=-
MPSCRGGALGGVTARCPSLSLLGAAGRAMGHGAHGARGAAAGRAGALDPRRCSITSSVSTS